jgi:hypothetical protein
MPAAPDLTGKMMGHGVYGRHSLAQYSAGNFGLPGLERAARAAAAAHGARPVVIADLGAAGGRNELHPMTVAIETLRDAGVTAPITVVHTDIPTNDFSALFETVEHDPDTYLRLDDVYTLAAGRSFYGRIFPPEALTLRGPPSRCTGSRAYPCRSTVTSTARSPPARCAPRSWSSRRPTGECSWSRGPRSFGPVPRWSSSEGPTRTTAAAAPRR